MRVNENKMEQEKNAWQGASIGQYIWINYLYRHIQCESSAVRREGSTVEYAATVIIGKHSQYPAGVE